MKRVKRLFRLEVTTGNQKRSFFGVHCLSSKIDTIRKFFRGTADQSRNHAELSRGTRQSQRAMPLSAFRYWSMTYTSLEKERQQHHFLQPSCTCNGTLNLSATAASCLDSSRYATLVMSVPSRRLCIHRSDGDNRGPRDDGEDRGIDGSHALRIMDSQFAVYNARHAVRVCVSHTELRGVDNHAFKQPQVTVGTLKSWFVNA